MRPKVTVLSNSPNETVGVGLKVGNLIKQSPLPAVVLLFGDLGSGKTTLIKGIAQAIGIDAKEVGSASFVIAAEYEGNPPFCHIDLYRLSGQREAEEMGIWDYIYRDYISVIEWADRLEDLPEATLSITIREPSETIREIVIEGIDEETWNNL